METRPGAFTFPLTRRYAANSLYFDHAKTRTATFLAEPATIARLDFGSAVKAECSSDAIFVIQQSDDCHGFVGWFRMRVGDKWLSTSPLEPALHWSQVFLPLDPAIEMSAGEQLEIRLVRPQFGDWSWIVRHAGGEQKHSTFYSRAISLVELRCHSKEHQVGLNESGELARFVLGHMTGSNSIRTIFDLASKRFGDRFSFPEELEKQIQSILVGYGK